MALLTCTECGGNVGSTAKACPHCGTEHPLSLASTAMPEPRQQKPPQKKKRHAWLWVLGAFAVLVIYILTRNVSPEEQAAMNQRRSERAAQEAKKEQQEATEKAASDNETKEMVWIETGKDAIKNRLKDPDSVQFKDVYFFRGKDNIPVTCGQVNSKNSYGGYSGFQHFISGGSTELTFLETEVQDFANAWNSFCTK